MKQNQEPEKWRDGVDPFTLPLKRVQLLEILGYPHAGNQVFYGTFRLPDGSRTFGYLKYAAHPDANIRNEVRALRTLSFPALPSLLDWDDDGFTFSVTGQLPGRRLSKILIEDPGEDALDYMWEYGRTLALLHGQQGDLPDAPRRRFHQIDTRDYYEKRGLNEAYQFLLTHKPTEGHRCFIHGDFHYANLLWEDRHISAILDLELCGMGDRDYDIAWALILRPGQQFLQTEAERQRFLEGYRSVAPCDEQRIRYYMVLIYARLLTAGDKEYEVFLRTQIKTLMEVFPA